MVVIVVCRPTSLTVTRVRAGNLPSTSGSPAYSQLSHLRGPRVVNCPYLTVEECQRLVEAAKADDNPQTLAFIMIGLHSAMRRTEILSIRREDVDLAARVIFVPKAKAGARKQPITSRLAEFLKDYLAAMPPGTSWLFPSPNSATGHTTDVRKAFRRAVTAAGLDPDRVLRHTLRHTAITHMVQALVNLPTVAVFSGHKTLAMVQRYAHANTAHVHTSLDKLDARLKKVG